MDADVDVARGSWRAMDAGPAGDDSAMGDAAEPPLSDALRMLLEEPADKHDRRIARAKARNRTVSAARALARPGMTAHHARLSLA